MENPYKGSEKSKSSGKIVGKHCYTTIGESIKKVKYMNEQTEKLYFEFKDTKKKIKFKINIESIFKTLIFLMKNEKIKPIPEKLLSEIKQKYQFEDKTINYSFEVIDTFDWEGEAKRAAEEQAQDKAYEKYIKKNSK